MKPSANNDHGEGLVGMMKVRKDEAYGACCIDYKLQKDTIGITEHETAVPRDSPSSVSTEASGLAVTLRTN